MSVTLLNMANAQFSHSRDSSHDNNGEISAILQNQTNLKSIFQFKTDAFCCLRNTAQLLKCWSSEFTCHSTSEYTFTDQ